MNTPLTRTQDKDKDFIQILNPFTGSDQPFFTDSTYLLHYAVHMFKIYVLLTLLVDFVTQFPEIPDTWLFNAMLGVILLLFVHYTEQQLEYHGDRTGRFLSLWDTTYKTTNALINYMSKLAAIILFTGFAVLMMENGMYSTEYAPLLTDINTFTTTLIEIGLHLSTIFLTTLILTVFIRIAAYPGFPVFIQIIEDLRTP